MSWIRCSGEGGSSNIDQDLFEVIGYRGNQGGNTATTVKDFKEVFVFVGEGCSGNEATISAGSLTGTVLANSSNNQSICKLVSYKNVPSGTLITMQMNWSGGNAAIGTNKNLNYEVVGYNAGSNLSVTTTKFYKEILIFGGEGTNSGAADIGPSNMFNKTLCYQKTSNGQWAGDAGVINVKRYVQVPAGTTISVNHAYRGAGVILGFL